MQLVTDCVWRHYKGGRYVLLAVAETHEHNGDLDVVYVSLATGKIVTRPTASDSRKQDAWTDTVFWPDGIQRQRFLPERAITQEELEACFEGARAAAVSNVPPLAIEAILRNEWQRGLRGGSEKLRCPACWEASAHGGHASDCFFDRALTEAGLPTQVERNAMRKQLGILIDGK